MKLHTIIWNTCGYVLVKYFIRKRSHTL